MEDTSYYYELLEQIDSHVEEVNDWEASFIESLLERKPKVLSWKQKEVIDKMKDKYLT